MLIIKTPLPLLTDNDNDNDDDDDVDDISHWNRELRARQHTILFMPPSFVIVSCIFGTSQTEIEFWRYYNAIHSV